MRSFLVLLCCFLLPAEVQGETRTLVAEKLLVQWGGPETRTRCSKWASTTGFKCNGLKCGRTTWKTCMGHATDLLQHKRIVQVHAVGYSGDVARLRADVGSCLERSWSKGVSATQVSNILKRCLTEKKVWDLRYSVSIKSETNW